MSRHFSVTEPHPSVPQKGAYIGSGRGGAGNIKKFKPEELTTGPSAAGPASRIPLTRPLQRPVPAGRGGAGNMVSGAADETIFQFDEEMLKKRELGPAAPVYHVGRGGAGNLFYQRPAASSSSRKDSSDSTASAASVSDRAPAFPQRRNSGGVLSIFSRRSA